MRCGRHFARITFSRIVNEATTDNLRLKLTSNAAALLCAFKGKAYLGSISGDFLICIGNFPCFMFNSGLSLDGVFGAHMHTCTRVPCGVSI
jgi:hypothetical protein